MNRRDETVISKVAKDREWEASEISGELEDPSISEVVKALSRAVLELREEVTRLRSNARR